MAFFREARLASVGAGAEEIDQRGEQVDPATAELDAQLETEPVGALLVRLDARVPVGRVRADDLVRVAALELDRPADLAELRHDPGREAAVVVHVAVALEQVVRAAAGRDRPLRHALEVDGAEALEEATRAGLGREVALDDPHAARGGLEEAVARVGGGDALARVVEEELDDRGVERLHHRAEAAAAIHRDLLGAQDGARGRRDGLEALDGMRRGVGERIVVAEERVDLVPRHVPVGAAVRGVMHDPL